MAGEQRMVACRLGWQGLGGLALTFALACSSQNPTQGKLDAVDVGIETQPSRLVVSQAARRVSQLRLRMQAAGPQYSIHGAESHLLARNPAQLATAEWTNGSLLFQRTARRHGDGRHEAMGVRARLATVNGASAPPVDDTASSGNRIELRRGAGLREWFLNGAFGVEHGFVVNETLRPKSGEFALTLDVDGDLTVRNADRGVHLVDAAGRVRGGYQEVLVQDAAGRVLTASLAANSPSEVLMLVDVSDAQWPIEIDPIWYFVDRLEPEGYSRFYALFGESVVLQDDVAFVGGYIQATSANRYAWPGTVLVFERSNGAWSLIQEIEAPSPDIEHRFGSRLAASGTRLLIGSPINSTAVSGVPGEAFVYERSGDLWTLQQELVPSAADSYFGRAVALENDTAVVGGSDSVSVYGFEGGVWSAHQRIDPVVANENFAVSITLEGDSLVVGSDQAASETGKVDIYSRTGEVWTLQRTITANDGVAGDAFGRKVVLNQGTVLIGAPGAEGTGAVYSYTQSGESWIFEQKLIATDGASGDGFGEDLGLDGDRAAIVTYGTPEAYVFERVGTTWSEVEQLATATYARNGASVDGDAILLGVQGPSLDSFAGMGRVFRNVGGTWEHEVDLLPLSDAYSDFGRSISVDGSRALVGTPQRASLAGLASGGAYVYRLVDGVWQSESMLLASDGEAGDHLGAALAMSGDLAVLGAPDHDGSSSDEGAVYVYHWDGSSWSEEAKLVAESPQTGEQFGSAVAIDGATLVVGTPGYNGGVYDGAVDVFVRSVTGTWSRQQHWVGDSSYRWLGESVAISGNTLVVSNTANSSLATHAVVYVLDTASGTWQVQQALTSGATSDGFGSAVAISGDTIVVGAERDDEAANDAGAVYVFTREGEVWTGAGKFLRESAAASDYLGTGVALEGDRALVASSGTGEILSLLVGTGGAWEAEDSLIAPVGVNVTTYGDPIAFSGNWAMTRDGTAVLLYNLAEPLENGAACKGTNACASGYCVDGVCCDEPCIGACLACTAALKGNGSDGDCEPISAGTDPEDECNAETSACGRTGECSGLPGGACEYPGPETLCSAAACLDETSATPGRICDGFGGCVTGETQVCATGYACVGDSCATNCVDDIQCAAGYFCDGSTCQQPRDTGLGCDRDRQCATDSCVDGICCESPCDGLCRACAAALTGQSNGTCAAVAAGLDPRGDCAADDVATCGASGACDGTGACEPFYAEGTSCLVACVGGPEAGFSVARSECDGAGSCDEREVVDCGLFGCAAGSCLETCNTEADCVTGASCRAGICQIVNSGAGGAGGASGAGGTGEAGGTGGATTGGGLAGTSGAAGSSGTDGGGGLAGTSGAAGSSGAGGDAGGAGGSPAETGGDATTGGNTAGASPATGGVVSAGGVAPTGGATPAAGQGGEPSVTGGTTATGGAVPTAGRGGNDSTGGRIAASGGATGSVSSGGESATGGDAQQTGGTGATCTPGTEGCACDAGSCEEGLTCLSDLCVDATGTPGKSGDEGGCGCRVPASGSPQHPWFGWVLSVLVLGATRRRRRSMKQREHEATESRLAPPQ